MGKTKSNVHFMSKTNEYETPQHFFDKLNHAFKFTLDPCATKANAKCEKFYTVKENGLLQSWKDEVVFMNPPYGRSISKWVEKAYTESRDSNATVVALIPARTDTAYWHEFIFNKAEVNFLRGRLKFSNMKSGAPFPSALVLYYGKDFKFDTNILDKKEAEYAAPIEES